MEVLSESEKEALKKALQNGEKIEKEATLAWDGSNILLRLPKEISDYLRVSEKNRKEKSILFKIEEKEDKVIKTFDIIDRTKKLKKIKKNVKKAK